MSNLKISIIIPTYNNDKYIEACLNSVICQMPDYVECIVINDGSIDRTEEILEEYLEKNKCKNLRIFTEKHKGVSSARNIGMNKAIGDYITFLDGDDILADGFFKSSEEHLKSDVDFIFFSIDCVTYHRRTETVQHKKLQNHCYNNVSEFADDYVKKGIFLLYSCCNKLYRNSIIKTNNLNFDENIDFGEDRLFNYEYLRYVKNITTSEIPMIEYMCRETISLSSRYIEGYMDLAMNLHRCKVTCITSLSRGTSQQEQEDYIYHDMAGEIMSGVKHLKDHYFQIPFKEKMKASDDIFNRKYPRSFECRVKDERGVRWLAFRALRKVKSSILRAVLLEVIFILM